eukprot:1160971-Pelagomonas_calceolata.AAC.6
MSGMGWQLGASAHAGSGGVRACGSVSLGRDYTTASGMGWQVGAINTTPYIPHYPIYTSPINIKPIFSTASGMGWQLGAINTTPYIPHYPIYTTPINIKPIFSTVSGMGWQLGASAHTGMCM